MADAPHDWSELVDLTRGEAFQVERVRLPGRGVVIEGAFVPPRLASLSGEDQVFVAAFLRAHGSIKEMEQVFGVSYPTVKSRLNRIAAHLDFGPVEVEEPSPAPTDARRDILARLAAGEITAAAAIAALERLA